MSQVLHPIELKIVNFLKDKENSTPEELEKFTDLNIDQIRRGIEWLRLKNFAKVVDIEKSLISLGPNGKIALEKGLPERKLCNLLLESPLPLDDLKKKLSPPEFNAAIANARKKNWIKISNSLVSLTGNSSPEKSPEEKVISLLGDKEIPPEEISPIDGADLLKKRPDFLIIKKQISKTISLDPSFLTEFLLKNKKIHSQDSHFDKNQRAIDVEAEVPEFFCPRTHPLQDVIDEIREAFVTLGFNEIFGNFVQPCFWNFDALFTPQDHPARELQDTFYLENLFSKKLPNPKLVQKVSKSHEKSWRYKWVPENAKKLVLRTHTTGVTIKYLAEKQPTEARIFSLGRVFRNEKVSYKHLVEFNQVEGIVVGKDANLRNLMGIQKEFYRKIGLTKIKFWPTFFPYTEPSLQTMVYNDRLKKWVELFGMGIFRQEVTKPLGITKPVLAWGGGIERIAMMKYALDDVREFYNNDLKWLRSVMRCP